MQTLTVDRHTWRCGMDGPHARGEGNTAMRNEEGYMCCLGHIALQLYSDTDPMSMVGWGEPECCQLPEGPLTYWEDGVCRNTELSQEAMAINDDLVITNEEREKQLTELFADSGFKLEFVG